MHPVSCLQIPSISFLERSGIVMLRYFSPTSAIEYPIPAAELRFHRDPKTGERMEIDSPSSLSRISHSKPSEAPPKPLKFDYKGNYGVGIHWSDGHYTDIFPYEVLKQIGQEVAAQKQKPQQ